RPALRRHARRRPDARARAAPGLALGDHRRRAGDRRVRGALRDRLSRPDRRGAAAPRGGPARDGRGGAALAGPLAGRQRHAGVRRDADRLDGVPRPLSPRVRRARAARREPVPGARPGGRRARARRVRRALRSHVRRGRRRTPLVIAGCGSALCSLAIAFTGPGAGPWLLTPLALVFGFFGIGWNGVQHTLMAELAGPRSAGTAVRLGLAIPPLGLTLGPPVLGWCLTAAGGYRSPWI